MEGIVKWFDGMKGYGFISAEGNDYFVHINQLAPGTMLKEGDTVTFEPAETERGKQAQNVRVGGSAPAQDSESSIEDVDSEDDAEEADSEEEA